MRINFDFGDLEAFLAVMETGSFHAASNRIGLSQSAITRRIQKLEQELDSTLFERTTRTVKPTLAAKRLVVRAQAMLADAQETTLSMRDESIRFSYQKNAVVTVSAVPTVVSGLLAPAVREFRVEGNVARVRILDGSANEVAEAVAQGEADFGICSLPELEPSTTFEPLFDDQMVVVMPAVHRLTEFNEVRWKDLERDDLILPTRGTGNRLLIDEAMARARLPLNWAFEVRRSSTAIDLVSCGVGIALLPHSSVADQSPDLIQFRAIIDPSILRPIGLVGSVGATLPAIAEKLADIIRHTAKEQQRRSQASAFGDK